MVFTQLRPRDQEKRRMRRRRRRRRQKIKAYNSPGYDIHFILN
jgi:hypothetical protein